MTHDRNSKLADILAQIIKSEDGNTQPFGTSSLLLLCPQEMEKSKRLIGCVSLEDRIRSHQKEFLTEQIIIKNLKDPALPVFENAIKEYSKTLTPNKKPLNYPADFPTIAASDFAPTETETVAQAREKLMSIQRSRRYRNYEELIIAYKSFLEIKVFKDCNWPIEKKNHLLNTWEKEAFRKPYPRQVALKERHFSTQVISLSEAFQIIHYFAQKFVDNPDQIRNGEIASLLCLMIALSYNDYEFTLKNLILLAAKDFHVRKELTKLHTSQILSEMIAILTKGKKLGDRVFSEMSVDWVEDAFEKASQELFPIQAMNTRITPGSFLHFPHPWPGKRIPPSIWYAMKNRDSIDIQPGNRVRSFLRRFNLPTQCFLKTPPNNL